MVTALLLSYLRQGGCNALAMKPFSSGSRADARLLRSAQENLLTLDEINPFYFGQPVSPAADAGARKIRSLDIVLGKIRAMGKRCDVLLVEGIGGLMVPLGEKYTVADLISRLKCPVLVVGRNRLGSINHTLLTVKALQAVGVKRVRVVLGEDKKADISARTNCKIIEKMAGTGPVFSIPDLGSRASLPREIKINVKYLQIMLAGMLGSDIFDIVLPERGEKRLFNITR